jgi:hypothetical protein
MFPPVTLVEDANVWLLDLNIENTGPIAIAAVTPVNAEPLPTKNGATTLPSALTCPVAVSVVTLAFTPVRFPNMSKTALFIVVLDMGLCAILYQ